MKYYSPNGRLKRYEKGVCAQSQKQKKPKKQKQKLKAAKISKFQQKKNFNGIQNLKA